jgi:hypothetical protein
VPCISRTLHVGTIRMQAALSRRSGLDQMQSPLSGRFLEPVCPGNCLQLCRSRKAPTAPAADIKWSVQFVKTWNETLWLQETTGRALHPMLSRFHCAFDFSAVAKCRKGLIPGSRGSSQWPGLRLMAAAESGDRDDAIDGRGRSRSRQNVADVSRVRPIVARRRRPQLLRQITTRHRHITLFPTHWGSAWRAWAFPADGITFGPLLSRPISTDCNEAAVSSLAMSE